MSELHKFIFEGLPVRGMLVRLTDAAAQAGLQNAAGRLRVARTQFLAFGAAAAAALTGVFMAARAGADDISATVEDRKSVV